MDLNRIATFVRVVDAESFTAAAKAIGLPKSSVSRSVARLEDELGVRLLHRTTRKLTVTDAGRAYYARAREALAGLDEATSAVVDMGKEPRGPVRVTAPADLGVALLPDLIARFQSKHPGIRVELSLTARRVDLVEEGFDFAIRAGQLADSTLIARKLPTTSGGMFAAPKYLRRRGKPKDLADLPGHDCILFRGRAGKATWKIDGPDGEQEIEVSGTLDVDDMSFARAAAVAGLGIALVPAFGLAHDLEQGNLVRVLPDYRLRGGQLHLVSPPLRYQPARVSLFRDFLLESLSAMRWEL